MVKLNKEALRKNHLFKDLSDPELELIAEKVVVKKYPKRAIVLKKGDDSDALLLLITGTLQVFDYTEGGKDVVLAEFGAGDYFGELSVIDGHPRSASVQTHSEAVVGFLDKASALDLFHHNPKVAKRLFERLALTIRRASQRQVMLNTASAYARVYMMLLSLLDKNPNDNEIRNLPTQKELSNMANTSRETVSRAIQALARKGIIDKEKKRIIVINRADLEAMIGKAASR